MEVILRIADPIQHDDAERVIALVSQALARFLAAPAVDFGGNVRMYPDVVSAEPKDDR